MYGGNYGPYGGSYTQYSSGSYGQNVGGGYGLNGGGGYGLNGGGGYGQNGGGMGGAMQEIRSDMWINQNIPGGVDSVLGERLDNFLGGNPNPTFGQMNGGAPGGYGGGYGYQSGRW